MSRPSAWRQRLHLDRLSARLAAALAIALLPMGTLIVALALLVTKGGDADAASPIISLGFAMALPLLLWMAALAVGWYALHRLVVVPLLTIGQAMARYGSAEAGARVDLRIGKRDFGSAELDALAASFDGMADECDRQSRDLRASLAEQQRLTREVHHRVKNNLQIISSLLAVEARAAADTPEIARVHAVIQSRIAALMQVHRWMYADAAGGVDLCAVIGDICAGLEAGLVTPGHARAIVTARCAAVLVHPDVAVPAAFLVTELAGLAASHGGAGVLAIEVAASQHADMVTLVITAASFVAIDRVAADETLPTARIIRGMARQLRAAVVHDPVAGSYAVAFIASGLR